MQTLTSVVGEVEKAVTSGDASRRVETLRKVTSLFVQQAPALQDDHVDVFDEVILRLARDLEFRARVELSDKLADVENAPRKVVRDLAFDDNIAVAKPVLERSARLTEDDLVEVASKKGQDHLFALSRRSTLTERVTDILVDRGDGRVVRSIAGNHGARFSANGFDQLVERARGDERLQSALKARTDVSPLHMSRLVEVAREKVRETLKAELGEDSQAAVDATVDRVAAALALSNHGRVLVDDFTGAEARVAEWARRGQLNEEKVVGWIREGKLEDSLAAMAHLAGIPVELVARAYHAANYDALLIVVRAVRFNWTTFKTLLAYKAGRVPPLELLKDAFEAFQQLTVPTAQRVLRFTLAREKTAQPDAA